MHSRSRSRISAKKPLKKVKSGPITNLPFELLSYIFRYHVDNGMSPWGLVKVCKAWKKAAIATPHLWRYICVTPGGGPNRSLWVVDGETHISRGNMQLCHDMDQLQAALQRSGVVTLEIHAECSRNGGWIAQQTQTVSRVLSLLWILISVPVSERIERLNLAAMSSSDANLPAGLLVGPFTRLTGINLPRQTWHQLQPSADLLLTSIDSTSDRLRMVATGDSVSEGLISQSFWSRIKRLELVETGDPSQLNKLVGSLVNLEHLSNCPRHWPNEHTPISTLENITEISLRCRPKYLDRLRLPNVESLTFNDTTGRGDFANTIPVLSYPKLTKLILHTHYPDWSPNLSTPLLAHLTLSWTTRYAFPLSQEPTNIGDDIFFHITSLKLQTPGSDRTIISALERAPNVRTVEILGPYSDHEFGLRLFKRLDANEHPIICPELESISLGSQSNPICTLKKNWFPLVTQMVASRKETRTPLRQFSVYWGKDRSLVESYEIDS